ncbi:MAG: acetyl-CoA carboxylase biotin carboxyl carrier protein subunit [Bacteroidales bacterium]|nr:acetyl-CoA carboxylase biotin carboxyl carrier protein subunit [Bacteroidales bacterium]
MENQDKKELVPFVILARYYNTTLTNKFLNRKKWENPIFGEMKAHLPGTIIEIFIKEGQKVKKGELLLIHEAMKMQNRVRAPFDGVVKSINVTPGEKIKKGYLMLALEPADDVDK